MATRSIRSDLPVLVVDDDPSFVLIVTAALAKAGLECEVALTGLGALDRLKRGHVFAVLLDLNLPDVSGLEVLRQASEIEGLPPIVLVSGGGSIKSAFEAAQLGADDFLEKPLKMSDLLAKVAELALRPSMPERRAIDESPPGLETMVAPRFLRLAEVVLRGSLWPVDFRNGRGLANASNVGHGTMRRWCRAADVAGRPLIRFARGFWAVHQSLERQCLPSDLLDLVDCHSVASVLDPQLPKGTSIATYCATQQHLAPRGQVVSGCLNLYRKRVVQDPRGY